MLFSDVEGSTLLLGRLGAERYAAALDLHRRILRGAFEEHGGYEVDSQGDAFFVAFASAPEAVAAAAAGQERLARAAWPDGAELRVRMGLHTGAPSAHAAAYVGLDVHKAARIMAAAHGGQVVLSEATLALLDGSSVVRDLGEHRLSDLSGPQRLHQLGETAFPPLRTLHRTNLPVPATAFLGRARELRELADLLHGGTRLVTLTGPGGSGKTRLALQAAAEAAAEFPGGVWWVSLARTRDAEAILPAVARALGVVDTAEESLALALGGKRMVLVVDNVEQLLPEAALPLGWLRDIGGPTVVVTSRERLQITGERVYPVAPLASEDAVELFVERARGLDEGFEQTAAVDELCARLDNLPLAIELAAARAGVLSVDAILARVAERLDVFSGARDAEPRQRTLRATLEWSYELLSLEERRLFARLAVFAGGCTLEAAEAICEAELDLVAALVDKSLLRRTGDRYWQLETIRDYAGELLHASGDEDGLRQRHADYFLALAEASEPALRGFGQTEALARLDAELDNLRAAFGFYLEAGASEALRLATAMGEFWDSRGYFSEGHRRLAEALAAVGPGHERRAWGELEAGMLADRSGDLGEAARLYAAALASGRANHDKATVALALLCGIGGASMHEHITTGVEAIVEESLELASSCGDRWVLATVTGSAGIVWFRLGDRARALEAYEEALRICRELGDEAESARWLNNLAWERTLAGDLGRAREASRAAGEIAERIGDRASTAVALSHLGWIALAERSPWDARECFERSLAITDRTGFRAATAWNLLGLAHVARATGDDGTAALLAAAALHSNAMGDVGYLMKELGLPEIPLGETDELPTQRAAVELALSFATPGT